MSTGSDAVLEHGGTAALVNLLRGAHMEAWASATHTLHMLCSSNPSATTTIMQAGQLHFQVHRPLSSTVQAYAECVDNLKHRRPDYALCLT